MSWCRIHRSIYLLMRCYSSPCCPFLRRCRASYSHRQSAEPRPDTWWSFDGYARDALADCTAGREERLKLTWHKGLAIALSCSGKRVKPAEFSTASTLDQGNSGQPPSLYPETSLSSVVRGQSSPGTIKLVKGVSSAMTSLGSTKAPMLYSFFSGEEPKPEEGREVRSTLAKWVGTATVRTERARGSASRKEEEGKETDWWVQSFEVRSSRRTVDIIEQVSFPCLSAP